MSAQLHYKLMESNNMLTQYNVNLTGHNEK